MTVKQSEQIRERMDLSIYDFSQRLGYSYSTYYNALKRGRLSRGLELAIAVKCSRQFSAVRQAVAT